MTRKIFFYVFVLLLMGSSVFAKTPFSAANLSEDEILSALHDQFLLAEDLLLEFDEQVAQGKSVLQLIQSNPGRENLYARILSLRALHEELTSEWQSRMQRKLLNESFPGQVKGISGWLESRVRGLQAQNEKDAVSIGLATHDLYDAARKLDASQGWILESVQTPERSAEFRQWRADFRKRGKRSRTARVSSVIRGWVDAEGQRNQEHLFQRLELEGLEKSQALRIFPSVSSSGNITGSSFPEDTWAVTFDDGPAATTPEVLANLKTHELRASFFVLASQLEKSAELRSYGLKAMQEGHDVFSHSFNHLQIPRLASDARKHEIEGSAEALAAVFGERPKFFRLPYGAGVSVKSIRQDILKSCMVHVFWNVDTLDWHDKDPEMIVARTRAQIQSQKRGIILFHDIHPQSVIASERILRELKEKGSRVLPVSEVVKEQNGQEAWDCKRAW